MCVPRDTRFSMQLNSRHHLSNYKIFEHYLLFNYESNFQFIKIYIYMSIYYEMLIHLCVYKNIKRATDLVL